jgi:3'-phosphoadenosine 5'-phosphosulfate sulfotransferase (PAPS reductase)/FAD synthetase
VNESDPDPMTFDHQHVVSFSGGVCSFWAAVRVVEKFGRENVTLLFADTLIEDEDLYRFNRDASAYLGLPITRIADGRTPWEVMRDERIIGNHKIDPCSKILKRELLERWVSEHCMEMATTVYLGLDWTEAHRLKRTRTHKPRWNWDAPMQWDPLWDKTRMFRELGRIGIEIPRLYKMGFPHNNCGGFCIKAGQAHFAHLLKTMPERFAYHEDQETAMRRDVGDFAMLTDATGGKKKPLPLSELRARIEAGKEYDGLEWGGCGCAVEPEETVAG